MRGDDQPFIAENAREAIAQIKDLRMFRDFPMAEITRFRTGGPADLLVVPGSRSAFIAFIRLVRREGWPLTVLGRASNVLVADRGIRGVTCVLTPAMNVFRQQDQTIVASAGARLDDLAAFAASRGLSGLEFACGIPGSVGGAVVMNAGAFGGSTEHVVVRTVYLDGKGGLNVVEGAAHQFGYRHSFFSAHPETVVVEAEYRLEKRDRAAIYDAMADFAFRRYKNQPLADASAGSAFQRPAGYFAGQLISEVGMKGYVRGRAGVSSKHAGFIVNCGGASASDIVRVFLDVRTAVFNRTGIRLIPEVRLIGAWESDPFLD